jgi:pSer/pThr/pTyr-binding forkhead associated (FHA) protein
MTGDSFTIGRGKSCDFVIDSNRVSREHVRILREGSEFVLEDLNSSNGTFYGPAKEKITRRKIKDGDEFTLGTEKIRFQIRK